MCIRDSPKVRSGIPALDQHAIGEAGLFVEHLAGDARNPAGQVNRSMRVDDNVLASPSVELPKLDEQYAAGIRKGRVTKAFRIEQERSGRPIAVLIREHAFEHEDLLTLGMVVRREP